MELKQVGKRTYYIENNTSYLFITSIIHLNIIFIKVSFSKYRLYLIIYYI